MSKKSNNHSLSTSANLRIKNQYPVLPAHWILPIISGILIALSQPPVSFSSIAYIAIIPLLLSWQNNNMRHNFLAGFLAGVVSYLGLIYWVVIAMNRYGGIDFFTSSAILLMLVLYLSLYTGLFALAVPFLEKKLSIPFFASAPVIWVFLEYLRSTALTGFPWSLLAYSQHKFLPLIQVVSITGPYFITFLIVAVNCIVFQIFLEKSRMPWNLKRNEIMSSKTPRIYFISYIFIIAAIFTVSLIYGYIRMDKKDNGELKASIIQGNTLQDVKWDEAYKAKIVKTYYRKTLETGKNADLIVWPETAMPFVFTDEIYLSRFIQELSAGLKTNILFGTVSKDSMGKFYNTAYIYNETGTIAGTYKKVHLVPFGEFTPLIRYFPFLAGLTAAGGNFNPGESHKPVETKVGKIGVLICYEGTFPYITNDTVRNGAQVLVNITNDAWFGKTSAPYQHLVFYIFRAIETDRYVLRAANTGVSAIIDTRGRIKQKTDIFREDALSGQFSLNNSRTLYVQYGDYFILAALLFLLVLCVIRGLKIKIKGDNG